MFVVLAAGFMKIRRLRRGGETINLDGYDVVISEKIPSPFSFFRTIYIGNALSDERLDIVLNHEKWHISHRHYLDIMFFEIICCLMWFNPFIWIIRAELRKVYEFETDRSVLGEGQDILQYQVAIMEEMLGRSPYAASGFGSSFTRRRFLMMKNTPSDRFRLWRHIVIVSIIALVFVLFCVEKGEARIIYVEKAATAASHEFEFDAVANREYPAEAEPGTAMTQWENNSSPKREVRYLYMTERSLSMRKNICSHPR